MACKRCGKICRASESTWWSRTIAARPGFLPGPSPRQDFLLRSGNETFALRLLARELSLSSDSLRLFSIRSLGRLLVEAPPFHLPEDAFALHLLLQGSKRLIDVVVADENLQGMFLSFADVTAAEVAQEMRRSLPSARSVRVRPDQSHLYPYAAERFGVGLRHAQFQGQGAWPRRRSDL